MRKILFLLAGCILTVSGVPAAETVDNPDEPLQGDWTGTPRCIWSVYQAGDDLLTEVDSMAMDEEERIYLFDYKQYKVYVLDSHGQLLTSFGRKGEGPGEFKYPWRLEIINGKLVVYDVGACHLFNRQGHYLRSLKSTEDVACLVGEDLLLTGREGEDGLSVNLYRPSDHSRKTIQKVANPRRIMAQGGGLRLRVRDRNMADALYALRCKDSFLFVQSGTYRIFRYDLQGKPVLSFGIPSRKPPDIPEAYKTNRYAGLQVNDATLSDAMLKQLAASIPDQGPHINELRVHSSGAVLAVLPEYEAKDRRRVDVFSPGGKYLYRGTIVMPGGLPFNQRSWLIHGDTLMMFTEDEEEEGMICKFKIDFPSL